MKIKIDITEEYNEDELLAAGLLLGHMRPAKAKELRAELYARVLNASAEFKAAIATELERLAR